MRKEIVCMGDVEQLNGYYSARRAGETPLNLNRRMEKIKREADIEWAQHRIRLRTEHDIELADNNMDKQLFYHVRNGAKGRCW